MNQQPNSPQERALDLASGGTDVYVSRLTNFERSYDKRGLNLTVEIAAQGRPVRQVMCHLSNAEALRLATLLTSEVAHDLETWPNGYSEKDRADWRAAGEVSAS